MQKTWGIYNGFNPRNHPLNKWKEPCCSTCNQNLISWIDWWNVAIGFCRDCVNIYVVKSKWRPSPVVHLKAEISELVAHELYKIDAGEFNPEVKLLLELHDCIPLDRNQIEILCRMKSQLQSNKSIESKLYQHLIWSLLFNSEQLNKYLIKEYIEFVYENPHYFEYNGYEVWIGHEIDIVKRLEKYYKSELTKTIYNIWTKDGGKYPDYFFKSRLGFYVSLDDSEIKKYGTKFYEFAKRIRQRI